jgi:hypothetical protein
LELPLSLSTKTALQYKTVFQNYTLILGIRVVAGFEMYIAGIFVGNS